MSQLDGPKSSLSPHFQSSCSVQGPDVTAWTTYMIHEIVRVFNELAILMILFCLK
jgi:hypothetical protein